MGKLTEKKVLSSARATSLKSVKNLNCWGSNIDDISIVRKMPNLEVLSLSVNSISTLEDLKYCPKLKDIYLRKNCISDIDEVVYLKHLPQLKVLWLSENPCTLMDNYRSTVINNLPNLVKLDNKEINEIERSIAQRDGKELQSCSSDLPDFTGLDLSVTLQENDLESFLNRSLGATQTKSTRKDIDIQTINEKREQLGLKPLNLVEYTSRPPAVDTKQKVSKQARSNACAATLLLLNELDAVELHDVIEAAEGLLKTLEIDDERDSICA